MKQELWEVVLLAQTSLWGAQCKTVTFMDQRREVKRDMYWSYILLTFCTWETIWDLTEEVSSNVPKQWVSGFLLWRSKRTDNGSCHRATTLRRWEICLISFDLPFQRFQKQSRHLKSAWSSKLSCWSLSMPTHPSSMWPFSREGEYLGAICRRAIGHKDSPPLESACPHCQLTSSALCPTPIASWLH